ncbi:hypothetical protein [Variovorax sp. YR752]|uniref:hypothetical protein n=1 Tax=Variovorax sp. YR752 TaxID=1884383 RepID=UPI00313818B3
MLQDSHVIPNFIFKPLRAPGGSMVHVNVDDWKVEKNSDSHSEFLLCEDCEGKISKWEDHGARRLRDLSAFDQKPENEILWTGFDYAQFKLFQLSVLWRAGVAKGPFFEAVSLGPLGENIRRKLLANDPGEVDFCGCIMTGILTEWARSDGFVYAPQLARHKGRYYYNFIFAGVLWIFSANQSAEREMIQWFLQKNGSVPLVFMDVKDLPNAASVLSIIAKNYRST